MDLSSTPQRRVLGLLDTNRVLKSPAANFHSPVKKSLGSSALSPVRQQLYAPGNIIARSPALKQKLDYVFNEGNDGEQRQRLETQSERMNDVENARYSPEEDAEDSQDPQENSFNQSSIFDTSVQNSQNTTMTDMDSDVVDFAAGGYIPAAQYSRNNAPRAQSQLTPEQVRQTAEALRLRLKLSMYKIRTNQIHTPLSQLTLIPRNPKPSKTFATPSSKRVNAQHNRAQSLQNARLLYSGGSPQHRGAYTQMKRRTPLPDNSRPRSANAAFYASASLAAQLGHDALKSSPPSAISSGDDSVRGAPAKMSLATPMLPRSRDGLMSGRSYEMEDLTSSVVKGRAADGLMQLMGGM